MIWPHERTVRTMIATKIRQAALYVEGGEHFNALLVLDEARAMIEKELQEEV